MSIKLFLICVWSVGVFSVRAAVPVEGIIYFKEGKSVGIHLEPGPDGGLVMIDDTTVLDRALKILDELNLSMQKEQATESVQV